MDVDPLFIIGTERSGSNLLRLILDSHPRLLVPHPPHVMRYFAPIEDRYGDLTDPVRFRRLVVDVLALVHAHIHPWPWVPDAEEVITRARRPDLFSVYVALHVAVRDHVGKARWGCKSTFMIDEVERIRTEWPGARLLWLFRDPRDVAASSRESVFSTFHPVETARLWTRHQDRCLALEADGVSLLRVRYEDLVADPEGQVRQICAYLGEDFHPPMLEFFRGAEARRSASLAESWRNTAAPIGTDGLARWRRDLTPDEVLGLEAIAGQTMERLGYTPAYAAAVRARFQAGPLRRARWRVGDRLSWVKVEARSLRRDRNVWRRWRRGWVLTRIRLGLVLHVG